MSRDASRDALRRPAPGAARRRAMEEPWERARSRRLRVAELFASIQGEGSRAGTPATFLRLTGCALRCRWCDTEWAFLEGASRAVGELADEILALGLRHVCVTGGEPLLQPSVVPLIRYLVEEQRLDVVVETGGDQDVSVLPAGAVRILDVKLPGSGMSARMDPANLTRLRPVDEVKLVVGDRRDYEEARRLLREELAAFRGERLLSAVAGELDPAELAAWVLEDRLEARVQVQLHKLLWPGRSKGV